MDTSLSKLGEIVKDREAWSAAVHEITKSQTRLGDWTTVLQADELSEGNVPPAFENMRMV